MHSFPEEELNLFGAWDSPYPVPFLFIPRHMVFMVEELRGRFDRTNPIIVGPEEGVWEAGDLGHRNALNNLLKMMRDGEGERFKRPRMI